MMRYKIYVNFEIVPSAIIRHRKGIQISEFIFFQLIYDNVS